VLGLAPQLSAAVVAFTIEADNEFEQRVEHITTRHGASGERGVRMSTNLDGMRRWGYITIDGVIRIGWCRWGEGSVEPRVSLWQFRTGSHGGSRGCYQRSNGCLSMTGETCVVT
jgi:hypothetical protein